VIDDDALELTARSASVTVVAQAGARAVSLLAVVGSTAIVARQLGAATYADWGTVLSLVALVSFALDPGVSPIVVRRIAQDPAAVPSPASLRPLRLALAVIAVVIVVGVSTAVRGTDVVLLAFALSGQLLPRALVLNATPWLQSDHRLHRQTALEAATAFGGLALLGIAALAGGGPALLALVGFTCPAALLAVLMRRELALTPSLRRLVPGDMSVRVRSLLREVAPLALALVLVATYTRVFVVFLNAAEDSKVVGRFTFAFQFVEQLIVAAGILAGAVLPLLAARARTHDLLRDGRAHELLVAVAGAGALASALIVAMAAPLTRLIGGESMAAADQYLVLLAPVAAVIVPAFLLAYVYVTLQRSARYLYLNAAALVLNIAANAWLTLSYGADATARISWGTELFVVVLALAPIARASASGAAATARVLATIAATVLASELVASDTAAPVLAAAGLVAAVGLTAGRPLAWLARAATAR
jgi:PST family polysaccharide transporter